MKKKAAILLILIILVFPVFVDALQYSAEVNKANDLLYKEKYVHTYEKYIVHGTNIRFEYSNSTSKVNSSFTSGGFISLDEFNLTKKNNVSYLFEGVEFWTLSKSGSNIYAITYGDITAKSPNSTYGGRVTEFVNPYVKISGQGKISNPWTFDSIYKVSALTDSRYATIESGNNVYVRGGCTDNDCTARIVITPKTGSRYITNDCDGLYDESNHTLIINNVKRDTRCTVSFGKGLFIVTLNKGTPHKIYLKYGENYYKEFSTTNIIRKIDSVEPKPGHKFIGYYYNDKKIINGDKEPNPEDNKKILYESVTGKYISSDVTLEPTYEANQYKVLFNCNGGQTPPTTQLITYNQQFTLTSTLCKREGFIQTSWNTKADGSGETWTTSNKTNVKWEIDHDVTLYAIWQVCPRGTYSPLNENTCIECPSGYFCEATPEDCPPGEVCPERRPTRSSCPDGYTSDSGAKSMDECYVEVPDGKYKSSATGANTTLCPAGTYKAAHKSYYGDSDTCNNCPSGMTSNVGSSLKIHCKIGCVAGNYLKKNESSCRQCPANSYCAGGTYNFNETTDQGITGCPSGMSSSVGSDEKSDCKRTCTAGTYLKKNESSCTQCPANSYCGGGTYGFSSNTDQGITGCPSGMSSSAGSSLKTHCKVACSAGNYLKKNESSCRQCPANSYCAGGTYNFNETTDQGITGCPSGMTSTAGSDEKADCKVTCTAGNYLKKNNSSCETCLQNNYCSGGTYGFS